MTYQQVIENLSNSILNYFDEVYHSTEITVNDAGKKLPGAPIADEYIDLSFSDQREIIYIRRNGEDEVIKELELGSCVKSYKMRSTLRIVYSKDHAEKHAEILAKLMHAVLIGGIKLKTIIRDKWKLYKDESSGDYNFGATTAYFALDVFALWTLTPDTCEQDFCIELENPLYKIEST